MAGTPVAITGMHRSGSSMVTHWLHLSGLRLVGDGAESLLDPADDNPNGFWENRAIVECNNDLLEAAGGAWDQPPADPPRSLDDPRVAGVVDRATSVVQRLQAPTPWGFKDPRLCLTAAFWMDLIPELRFVICLRNPLEVALSLQRRNRNSYTLALSLWERYYSSIIDLVPVERRIITHYDAYFHDAGAETERVGSFVGLDGAPPNVDPGLRHHDVDLALSAAELSDGLRSLYGRLCDEAGVENHDSGPAGSGQVNRLILDGVVAARHAEQRQRAIERLEERLAAAAATERSLHEELRSLRTDSAATSAALARSERELQLARHDIENFRQSAQDQAERMANLHRDTAEQFAQLGRQTATLIDQQERLRAATDTVRDSAQDAVTASRRIEVRQDAAGSQLAEIDATLDALRMEVDLATTRPEVRGHGEWQTRSVAFGGRVLRASARRLPEPAQDVLRRARTALADEARGSLPGQASRALIRSRRQAPIVDDGASAAGDLGASVTGHRDGLMATARVRLASHQWMKEYERLVSEFVQPGEHWCAVTACSPAKVCSVRGRWATAFPDAGDCPPPTTDLALTAILEAHRINGSTKLVVPEGAREWLRSHALFVEHLHRYSTSVTDRPGAGIVVDLAPTPTPVHPTLRSAVKNLVGGPTTSPIVLDWTTFGIASELPGITTFTPLHADDPLPYLDHTVDVVVATPDRDRQEADRVAIAGVVIVEQSANGARVIDDEHVGGPPGGPRPVSATKVVVVTDSTGALRDALAARAADAGARLASSRTDVGDADSDADVVIVLDAGVMPLPGAIEALAAAVARTPERAFVGKVIDAHGRLESAGGMVFSDGSAVGIGAGSADICAPWHEFVRSTCWGGGAFAVSGDLWADADDATIAMPDRCARSWNAGTPVFYDPTAVLVRVRGEPIERADAWASMTDRRPTRPHALGDGAWRYLLAHDQPASLSDRGAG